MTADKRTRCFLSAPRDDQNGAAGQVSQLFCPRCNRATKTQEWRLVYRRVVSADGKTAGRVLEHTNCEVLVYLVLK